MVPSAAHDGDIASGVHEDYKKNVGIKCESGKTSQDFNRL